MIDKLDPISTPLDNFFKQYKQQVYNKGEILIAAASNPHGLFYLTEGTVRQYSISPTGDEVTLNVYKPPSLFPMGWVLNNTSVSHYFEAITSVTVWIAPQVSALAFLQNEPTILLDLVKRIYRGLDGHFMKIEHAVQNSAYEKLVVELLIHARRFGEQKGNHTAISMKLSEKDLGSQAWMARETVSRILQKLKKKGIIALQKNTITIRNIKKLEQELSPS